MSDYPNGNGNGNGHEKPFVLAKPKTAEEIDLESKRKIAPQIRSDVNFSHHPAPEKFFFGALLDLTFLYRFGGDGRGRIFTNVIKLSRILKHHKDSIAKWRDYWVREKLLWVSEGWPRQEWRICPLYPAPSAQTGQDEFDYIVGKAANLQSLERPPGAFLSQKTEEALVSEDICTPRPETPSNRADVVGSVGVQHRLSEPKASAVSSTNPRLSEPKTPAVSEYNNGKGEPKTPAHKADKSTATMETPKEIRSNGAIGGGALTLPIPKFEALDAGMWPKDRIKWGEKQISYLGEKIYGLQNSRKPASNQADVVGAYKQRVKEIKKWMAGEVS
jgi:hypothetical protein